MLAQDTIHSPSGKALRLADVLHPERNSFNVIRLAMAIAVLVSHSFFFVTGAFENEPLVSITGHSLGQHGVQVFFLLSGVLVTESLLRRQCLVSFLSGRVLRIFPGLAVCVLLTALVLGPIVSQNTLAQYFADPMWLTYVAKTMLLVTGAAELPGVFAHNPAGGLVNMSLWTLKYEVLCYLALAVAGGIGLFRERYRMMTAGVLALFVATVFLKSPEAGHVFNQSDNFRYFALYFGMGCLACLLKDYIVIRRWLVLPLMALFLASIGKPWAELTCAMFLGYAALVVGTFKFGPLRGWCNRCDVSYGVYIYAAPIQQTLVLAYPGIDAWALTGVALALTTVPAALSWIMIERPAMALRGAASAMLAARLERAMGYFSAARLAPRG